jgi:hypothetical protein
LEEVVEGEKVYPGLKIDLKTDTGFLQLGKAYLVRGDYKPSTEVINALKPSGTYVYNAFNIKNIEQTNATHNSHLIIDGVVKADALEITDGFTIVKNTIIPPASDTDIKFKTSGTIKFLNNKETEYFTFDMSTGNFTVQEGNISLNNGNMILNDSGNITLSTGNITLTKGNLSAIAGTITAKYCTCTDLTSIGNISTTKVNGRPLGALAYEDNVKKKVNVNFTKTISVPITY